MDSALGHFFLGWNLPQYRLQQMRNLIEEQQDMDSRKKEISPRSEDIRSSGEMCVPSPESKVLRPEWEEIFWQNIFKRLIIKTRPKDEETDTLGHCCWDCHLAKPFRGSDQVAPVSNSGTRNLFLQNDLYMSRAEYIRACEWNYRDPDSSFCTCQFCAVSSFTNWKHLPNRLLWGLNVKGLAQWPVYRKYST